MVGDPVSVMDGGNLCTMPSCEQVKILGNNPKANNKTGFYVVPTDKRAARGMDMFHPKYPVSLPKDTMEEEGGSMKLRI